MHLWESAGSIPIVSGGWGLAARGVGSCQPVPMEGREQQCRRGLWRDCCLPVPQPARKEWLYVNCSWQSFIPPACCYLANWWLLATCRSQLPEVFTSQMLGSEMALTDIYLLSQQKNVLSILCLSIPRDALFTSVSPVMKAEGFAVALQESQTWRRYMRMARDGSPEEGKEWAWTRD